MGVERGFHLGLAGHGNAEEGRHIRWTRFFRLMARWRGEADNYLIYIINKQILGAG